MPSPKPTDNTPEAPADAPRVPGPRDRWVVREGWQPLGGIGPEPMTDEEFRQAAAGFAEQNACSVDDVIANGPYVLVENYAPADIEALEAPTD